MPKPGAQLDRYVVDRLLGRGGMGEVWLAQHRLLGTSHALKVLLRPRPRQQERLLEEGRTQARLDHPNVVPVRDVFESQHGLVLVLPFVDGPPLDALLQTHRPTPAEAGALVVNIAAGIAAAHGIGVVHRDVKPANVLVDLRRGRAVARLADFGLAVRDHQGTGGRFEGTLAYAAPEQLAGAPVGPAADVWALGMVTYELLTGARPLSASDPDTRAEQARQRAWTPAGRLRALDPAWDRLLAAMLAPEPADRPRADEVVVPERTALDPSSPLVVAAVAWRAARSAPPPSQASTATFGPDSTFDGTADDPDDPLVGRDAELAAVADRLAAGGVVTLVGAAGSGKTRLAEVAAAFIGNPPLVRLDTATDAAGALEAVARAVGVRASGRGFAAAVDRAVAALPGLVLDNCEHLLDAVADMVQRWRSAAPDLVVLATSREPLRLRSEAVVPVGPLALPRSDALADVQASPAVALFVERVGQVRRDFALTADNAAEVAALVGQLDGLPLALELAAGRLRTTTIARIRGRLSQRFRLLQSKGRDVSTRHRTLRGALDWSWDLLRPWERAALSQLAVFAGTFAVDEAEEVVDLDAFDDDAPWLEDVVAELAEKSWLQVELSGREPRYRMLVSVQAYARLHLDADPDAARDAEVRHAAWLAARVYEPGPPGERWLGDRMAELEAATRRAVDRGDAANAGVCGLGWLRTRRDGWDIRKSLAVLETVLPVAPDAGELVRRVAWLRFLVGDMDGAVRGMHDALAVADRTGDRRLAGDTHNRLGILAMARHRPAEALPHLDRALAIARERADGRAEAEALAMHGDALSRLRRYDDARAARTRALELAERTGHMSLARSVGSGLAKAAFREGRFADARAGYRRTLEHAQASGDKRAEGLGRGWLGMIDLEEGDVESARRRVTHALELHEALGYVWGVAQWTAVLVRIASLEGRADEPAAWFARSTSVAGAVNAHALARTNFAEHLLRTGEPDAAEALVAAMTDDDDPDLHLLRAELAAGRGEPVDVHLERARARIHDLGHTGPTRQRRWLDRLAAAG